jgi:hypothetical protein
MLRSLSIFVSKECSSFMSAVCRLPFADSPAVCRFPPSDGSRLTSHDHCRLLSAVSTVSRFTSHVSRPNAVCRLPISLPLNTRTSHPTTHVNAFATPPHAHSYPDHKTLFLITSPANIPASKNYCHNCVNTRNPSNSPNSSSTS